MCTLLKQALSEALNRDYIKLDVFKDGDYIVISTMTIDPSKEIYFEFRFSGVCYVGITSTVTFITACIKAGFNVYHSDYDYQL